MAGRPVLKNLFDSKAVRIAKVKTHKKFYDRHCAAFAAQNQNSGNIKVENCATDVDELNFDIDATGPETP